MLIYQCLPISGTAYSSSSSFASAPPTVAPTVAPDASCFAGSETVLLEKGETVSISSLKVGDRVLAADINGKATFSEVVAVPHGLNNDRRVFSQIRTVTGRDIKLTPNHMILAGACNAALPLALIKAEDVKVGSCVQSVDGREEVVSHELVQGFGIYTFITQENLVVVNGIVASPFADNHAVATAFYNIHRAIYVVAPSLLQSDWVKKATLAFGSIVFSFST